MGALSIDAVNWIKGRLPAHTQQMQLFYLNLESVVSTQCDNNIMSIDGTE